MNKIEKQTEALETQLKRLKDAKTDEDYIKELEIYNLMVKGSDFSIESQAASKKKKLKWYDKAFAHGINKVTRQIKKRKLCQKK